MLKTYFKSYKAKNWIFLAVASIILSVCGVIGASYAKTRIGPSLTSGETLLYIGVGIIAFAVMLVAFDLVLELIANRKTRAAGIPSSSPAAQESASRRGTIVLDRITPSWNAKSIAIFTAIMLVLWSPWIIAYFPAPVNVDLYHQIYQFFPDAQNYIIPFGGYDHNVPVDAWLVDHHPFFTTIIYGSFGWVSEQLTGNWEAGIFACSLLHAVCFVVAYTASIAFLKRAGCPTGLCLAIWSFFALMPFVVVWSIGLTKDSTFTLFLIGYLMMLFNAYRTGGELFARPRNIVLFILCSLALCLTKKTGIYIVVVVSLALAWRFRPGRLAKANAGSAPEVSEANELAVDAMDAMDAMDATKARSDADADTAGRARPSLVFLGSALTSVLLMFLLVPFVLFPALNIAPGGKQEALGLAFQQTARYVIDHGDEVTPAEKAAISKVLAFDEIEESYNPRVHDYVKFLFDQDATTSDIIEYLKVYAAMGLKHPESYFDATMGAAAFYLSFDTPVYITLASSIDYPRDIAYSDKETSEGDALVIWAPAEVAGFKDAICGAYYAICEMPVIGFFLRLALYTMWIPMALLLFMLRRGSRCKALLLPGLLLFLVCLISPIGATRYATAMICTVMLIVGMTIALSKDASACVGGRSLLTHSEMMDRVSVDMNARSNANEQANAPISAKADAADSDPSTASVDDRPSGSAIGDAFSDCASTSIIDKRFAHPARTYLAFAGILFVLWIPVYLAAYPGFFCYDMSYGDVPMWEQYSVWEFVGHHPVAQTLVMGFIIDTVFNLTGAFNDGVAVYVALQNILLAFIFALMILCIDRTLRSRVFTACALAYLVLNPLVVLFVECTAKDTLFSAFVVMFCTVFFAAARSGIFRSKESFAAAPPRESVLLIVCILISGIGVCIMRTNGIIAFVLSLVFVVICARGAYEKKVMAGICCGALVISLVWLGPIAMLMNVKDSQFKDSFIYSIPAQQISYVLERDGATDEELKLARDLGYVSETAYMAKLADLSKWQLRNMSFSQVMQLYFTLGAAHPQAYFFVFVEQTQGMWNPYALDRIYPDGIYEDRETSLFAFDWERPAHSDTKFPALKEFLRHVSTENFLQRVPVVSLFVTLASYVWILLLAMARCLVTRDRSIGVPVALLFFVALSAFFGPCVLARYYLCLIFGLPLMVAFLCCAKSKG